MKFITYLTASLTFLAIVAAPVKMANGCGAGDYGMYVYSFIEPKLLEEPSYRPFFFTFQYYYDEWQGEQISQDENLTEWSAYFNGKCNNEDLTHVVYKSSIEDLKAVIAGKTPSNASSNSLYQLMLSNPDAEFLNYMIYAKSCEPYATEKRQFDWWEGTLDVDESYYTDAESLIKKGLAAFSLCKSDFLKLRYAFQIVRMARYAYKWERAIQLYEQLMPEVKQVNSFIQYWTREHYAGALYNAGKKTEANYHFAQIFDQCPSRRMPAYKSFKIKDDAEWSSVLAMCKNADEKAALYAIRAIDPINNGVQEMKEIYKLTPKSKHLNFLLIREIQKLEYELLGADYNHLRKNMSHTAYDPKTYDAYVDFPRKGSKVYLAELKAFVNKCAKENKIQQLQVWQLAQGYLEFIDGNHDGAMYYFRTLQRANYGETFAQQIEIFKAAVEVDQMDKVDAATEKRIAKYVDLLKNREPETWGVSRIDSRANFLLDKMVALYAKSGQRTKAFLCKKHTLHELLSYPDLEVVTGLIALLDKDQAGQLNEFEKSLTKPFFYQKRSEWKNEQYVEYYDGLKDDIRNMLIEMKGTAYLAKNELDKAITTYETLPAAYHEQAKFPDDYWVSNSRERFNLSHVNPFHLYMGSEKVRNKDKTFNKLKLAKQLKRLQERIKNGEGNPARFNYLLGLLQYNMSYHGKAWRAIDYYKTSYPGDEISENLYGWSSYGDWGNQSFQYNDNALAYLNQAIALATDEDREWAAKACFVAGNCKTRNGADNRKRYWDKLKKEFADTEFYDFAISECDGFQLH